MTDLLRQLYVVDLPHNILAIVRDRGNVPAKVLPALTGKSQDTFLTAWNATLETARPGLSTALAALPRLGLDLEFVPEGEDTVAVRYRATITPPPTETLTWRLRWSMLRPFDQMVAERDLMIFGTPVPWGRADSGGIFRTGFQPMAGFLPR
ncbi:MAG: hypothetical protein R3F31_18560 [Verrucomicrobiales bacterium]